MSIPSVNSVNTMPPVRVPEKAERPGQEHDGDADDKGAGVKNSQAIASNGAGGIVNTKA